MAVCVAGSMRDPTDYAAAYGADPPADAPLKRKLRRLLQQKEGLSASDARDRAGGVLLAAKTAERNPTSPPAGRRSSSDCRARSSKRAKKRWRNGAVRSWVSAPDADLTQRRGRSADAGARRGRRARGRGRAGSRRRASQRARQWSIGAGRRGGRRPPRATLRADEAVDVVDLTSRALGDGDEEAARRRNAADAERLGRRRLDDDETDDAEEANSRAADDDQGGR